MSESKESSRKREKTMVDLQPSCSNLISLFDEFVIDDSKKVGQKRGRVKADSNVNMIPIHKIPPPSQWFSVYNARKPMIQRYYYNLSDGRLLQHVEKGISDKFCISCVSSCSNLWAVIMDDETDYSDQVCKLSPSFLPKEWIMEQWSKNFFITSFAGSENKTSVVVMSKGTRYTQQSYKLSRSFPKEWVNKKWKQGFHVTSMGTAGIRWCIVMSRNAGFTDQVVELDFLYPSEAIQKLLDKGYMITATAASLAQSAVILSIPSKLLGYETQETLVTPKFPRAHVEGKWPKSFYLSHLCNGPRVC
ncbi:casein kinase 1-like protein HD16 [Vicia villosa]|uniref:casein kinase 1-like protein HD16 n=1 Tax=Vicia villosa TaxID=3911 RepID=UPI00273BD284|nr:casein kinase 1-like protein HD16 [Vicia villosa]